MFNYSHIILFVKCLMANDIFKFRCSRRVQKYLLVSAFKEARYKVVACIE